MQNSKWQRLWQLTFIICLAWSQSIHSSEFFEKLYCTGDKAQEAQKKLQESLPEGPYEPFDDFIPWPGISGIWSYTLEGLYVEIAPRHQTDLSTDRDTNIAPEPGVDDSVLPHNRTQVTLSDLCSGRAIASGSVELVAQRYEDTRISLNLEPVVHAGQGPATAPVRQLAKAITVVIKSVAATPPAPESSDQNQLSISVRWADSEADSPVEELRFINLLNSQE